MFWTCSFNLVATVDSSDPVKLCSRPSRLVPGRRQGTSSLGGPPQAPEQGAERRRARGAGRGARSTVRLPGENEQLVPWDAAEASDGAGVEDFQGNPTFGDALPLTSRHHTVIRCPHRRCFTRRRDQQF